jgi:hypothetical protein
MANSVEFLFANRLELSLKAFNKVFGPFRHFMEIVIALGGDFRSDGMNFFHNGIFEHFYSPFSGKPSQSFWSHPA